MNVLMHRAQKYLNIMTQLSYYYRLVAAKRLKMHFLLKHLVQ
jgi:hypothetical protein